MKAHVTTLLLTALVAMNAHALEVSKEQWIAGVKVGIPIEFCKPNQIFRQCFEVTAEECEQVAASTTRVCINDMDDQIPAVLVQPEDGTHWGTIIGRCAGSAYVASLMNKRILNARCNDARNWQ